MRLASFIMICALVAAACGSSAQRIQWMQPGFSGGPFVPAVPYYRSLGRLPTVVVQADSIHYIDLMRLKQVKRCMLLVFFRRNSGLSMDFIRQLSGSRGSFDSLSVVCLSDDPWSTVGEVSATLKGKRGLLWTVAKIAPEYLRYYFRVEKFPFLVFYDEEGILATELAADATFPEFEAWWAARRK